MRVLLLMPLQSAHTPKLTFALFQSAAYYHEMFLRGRPDLARRMRRVKCKGNGPRKPANPELEPNFYHMQPVDGDGQGKLERTDHSGEVETHDTIAYTTNPSSSVDPLQLWHTDQRSVISPGLKEVGTPKAQDSPTSVAATGGRNLSSILDNLLYWSQTGVPPSLPNTNDQDSAGFSML